MRVLFLCTHNRCRSIIAEAVVRALDAPELQAASAGSAPEGKVHPLTLRYLQAGGISVEDLASKGVDDVREFDPDLVITLCDSAAGEACPLWLGSALRVHWGVEDPSKTKGSDEEVRAAFEACINTLSARAELLRGMAGLGDDRGALSRALNEAGAAVATPV